MIDAQASPEAPAASFAIWDDGSMSISRGEDSMYLATSDVRRLAAHMARFRA